MKKGAVISAAILVLCSSRPAPAADSSLAARIAAIISRPEYRHTRFGMEFWSITANQPVYRLDEQQFFTAASTTKLLTEGTALSLLGPDYHFHTAVYRTGPIAPDGTLNGDLVLVAAGDPNLSNRIQPDGTLAFQNKDHAYDTLPGGANVVPGDPLAVIRELAAQVAKAGVRKVAGHVLVDVSMFPEGDRELGTGVVLSPVAVNDNLIDVFITSETEGAAPRLSLSPATQYVHVINQVKTVAPGRAADISFNDERAPDGSYTVTVLGTVPPASTILRTYRVPEPSRFAQMAFVEALREAGVSAPVDLNRPVPGASARAYYKPGNQLAEHVSPPFSEEAKVTLKVSQNLHAGMTPYILGAVAGANHLDPLQAGFDLEKEFLGKAGLDVSGASQSDGAGGAAFFTPDFMVHYLIYLAGQDRVFPAFFKALPILGKDGTLWDIQTDSPAAGHVHAKTGTLATGDLLHRSLMLTAKGIAGYIDRKDGQRLAFAAYLSMFDGDPDTVMHTAGSVLGEIAAAAYDAP
ncbi:MAG: D-alanyl-D-alanine carboxypeptidase/D-alanyl-D-alanine-endopeptidase [Bryobacteraceae bacterium]|jgi:D-alanyl-D-alanine carboxypeptidase/D-alanyl-D-alanine-endopeptidase (penicillin-binding protein 4)